MAKKAKAAPAEVVEEKTFLTVPKKAMLVDLGPEIIKSYAEWSSEDVELRDRQKQHGERRWENLTKLTGGVLHVAKNDPTLDLEAYFGGENKSVQEQNDKLGLALGWRVSVLVGEGDKQKQKIEYAPSVSAYFPAKGDNEDEKRRKSTLRSNFLHALKKAAMAAAGIRAKDMEVKVDKASGTLRLSGPAIKKEFGQESVLLNEKEKVVGKKGEVITLKAKPSFTSIAAMGAREYGAELTKRKDSRATTVADPTALLKETVETLVKVVSKIEQPDDKQIKLMEKAFSALSTALGYDDEDVGEEAA